MRCVLVLGGPRAGTSLCAGMLHRLGVRMGDDLGDANEWNPDGFYEDGEFADIYGRMVCGDGNGTMEDYMPARSALTPDLAARHADLIRSRCGRGRTWGVKNARLCYVLPDFVLACLCPVSVVRMLRPPADMAASWAARSGVAAAAARETVANALAATDDAVSRFGGPVLPLAYPAVLADPAGAVASLAAFAGVAPSTDAVSLVRPELRRF